jgi:hypothetical protein
MLSDLRRSSPLEALKLSILKLEAEYRALLDLRAEVRKAQRAQYRPLLSTRHSALARRSRRSIRMAGLCQNEFVPDHSRQ